MWVWERASPGKGNSTSKGPEAGKQLANLGKETPKQEWQVKRDSRDQRPAHPGACKPSQGVGVDQMSRKVTQFHLHFSKVTLAAVCRVSL